MKKKIIKALDAAAKTKGYSDRIDLLRDYSFVPTVLMPEHKKIEIIPLIIKTLNRKNNG